MELRTGEPVLYYGANDDGLDLTRVVVYHHYAASKEVMLTDGKRFMRVSERTIKKMTKRNMAALQMELRGGSK